VDSDLKKALRGLDEAIGNLSAALKGLPPELQRPAEWGAREMLVHIVFAHELYVSYLKAIAKGERPPLFEGRYVDQNALALAQNSAARVQELAERLRAAHAELSRLVALESVQKAPFYAKRGAKRRTLVEALEAGAAHIRGHTREIRRLGKKAKATPR
jgi:hypothetical protein